VTNLERLPERMDRVESQIVQLRTEMHDEFSAVREEIRTAGEEVKRELREEIRAGDEETRRLMHALQEEVNRELREEIRGGDEETRRLMRVLHEDVIGRFSLLTEGRVPGGRRKRRREDGE